MMLLIDRVFLAGQFEYLMVYLKKLVPDSKQSFLMQFLSHVCTCWLYVKKFVYTYNFLFIDRENFPWAA